MKLNRKNSKRKGFTLIELMVVVSVILILSGFIVPKVLGYQDKAKKAKAVNTATQIFDASMASYTEEEGILDKDKISGSILAVTGLAGTNLTVAQPNATTGNVVVTFKTDGKIYDVNVTAKDNKFSVTQYANATDTGGTIPIYPN